MCAGEFGGGVTFFFFFFLIGEWWDLDGDVMEIYWIWTLDMMIYA